jgi:hypothetical protein
MRELVPYYFVNGKILGWMCGTCKQEFERGDGDASEDGTTPAPVQQAFDAHTCTIAPQQNAAD